MVSYTKCLDLFSRNLCRTLSCIFSISPPCFPKPFPQHRVKASPGDSELPKSGVGISRETWRLFHSLCYLAIFPLTLIGKYCHFGVVKLLTCAKSFHFTYQYIKSQLNFFLGQNEEALKKYAEEYLARIKREEQRYQALKAHAEEKLHQ